MFWLYPFYVATNSQTTDEVQLSVFCWVLIAAGILIMSSSLLLKFTLSETVTFSSPVPKVSWSIKVQDVVRVIKKPLPTGYGFGFGFQLTNGETKWGPNTHGWSSTLEPALYRWTSRHGKTVEVAGPIF